VRLSTGRRRRRRKWRRRDPSVVAPTVWKGRGSRRSRVGIRKLRGNQQSVDSHARCIVESGEAPAILESRIGVGVEEEIGRIRLVQCGRGDEWRHASLGFARSKTACDLTSRLERAPSSVRVSAVPQQEADYLPTINQSSAPLLDGFLKGKAIAAIRPAAVWIGARLEQRSDDIGRVEHNRMVEWQGTVSRAAGDRFTSLRCSREGTQVNVVHVADGSRDRRTALWTRCDRITTLVRFPSRRRRSGERVGATCERQRREHDAAGCPEHWIR
jgi:hypothetical protein